MNLFNQRLKYFNIASIFLLLKLISKIHCLIELPITKISSPKIPKYPDFIPNTEIPEYIKNKILLKNPSNKNKLLNAFNSYLSSLSPGNITIIQNLLFTINIKLGSSKQLFSLLVDTGSSITWVPIKNSHDFYPLEHHYDPSISSTSIKKSEDPFEIEYGSGYCKGNYYSDNIIYIKDKEFKMDFGAADKTNFFVTGADGILGLSRIYDDYDKSFINMMCKGHITDSQIFSVKLGVNSTQEKNGTFYIGKHSDFDKDSVVSCELNNDNYYEVNYWSCDILSFSVENKKENIKINSEKKISVIFDTGTNAIFLPYSYLEDTMPTLEKMNCFTKKYKSTPNRYQLICLDNLPDFNLNIGGHTFILPGKYFFSYEKGFAYSDIFFQESSTNKDNDNDNEVYIIGSPFFILFHVLFDSYTKELFFYPEIDGTIIKGSWWNKKHIVIVIIFILIIIFTSGLIILFILWNKKNKLEFDEKLLDDKFEIRTYFSLL